VILVVVGLPILLVSLGVLTSFFQNRNGERTVRGYPDLQPNTIACEDLCSQLRLPEGSRLLRTDVTSKRDSGVVTSNYVFNGGCNAAQKFFLEQRGLLGEVVGSTASREFFIFTRTEFQYRRDVLTIRISCGDMRDWRGEGQFSVSCSWNRD
jgi:hypothetical protein